MDTLHCGYPVAPMASMGLGAAPMAPMGLGAAPMSPPVTPTELSHNGSPTDSGFSSPDFLQDYSDSQCTQTRTPPNHFEEPLLTTGSDHFDLSSSHPRLSPPTSPSFTPETTPVHTPLSSTPRKLSRFNDRSRKNSFVYDVRLTDEQFLFFVPDPDLVKSHLMFAVREEVEVLKEKIGELMDRISQLEYENTVLRQCATQDALQQIAQPHPNSNT